MGGRSSQSKGRRAELELVELLRSYGFDMVEAGKPMSYGEMPDVVGLPGVHLEVKRCETLRLPQWLEQAERDAARFQDGAPAVFFRQSRKPWYVVMRLSDWLPFYKNGSCER